MPRREIKIKAQIDIRENLPKTLSVNDGVNTIVKYGEIASRAISRPITKEDVAKQIKKTGNTIYKIEHLEIFLDDNIFVNLKDLNNVRRQALEELDAIRMNSKRIVKEKEYEANQIDADRHKRLLVVVNTEDQYKIAKKYTDDVYTSNYSLLNAGLDIYPKYIDSDSEFSSKKYMISDYGSLRHISINDEVTGDYMLNVLNSFTIRELLNCGLNSVCLSLEANLSDLAIIKKNIDISRVVVFLYGKIELMKLKYSPIEPGEELVDRNGMHYKIKRDGTYNYLMSSNPVDHIESIDELMDLGVTKFRIDLFDEDEIECEKIIEKVHKKISEE